MRLACFGVGTLLFLTTLCWSAGEPLIACETGLAEGPVANTFSIVAFEPDRQEWGVGVASRVLAVGAAVPWARASVGAVATQASTNLGYGPKGLELLAQGKSAEEAVKLLTDEDKQ